VAFDVNYLGTVDTGKGKKAGFKITGDINRFEFNLNWDNKIQNGSLVVGETIRIICNVELNQVES
jgi:polyisoprenoid-binding protein YceI